MEEKMDKLEQMLKLDVSKYTKEKGKLTYLSWANAWQEFIKIYPLATYKIKKKDNGECWFGNTENGYFVYTTVTVGELTHEMWLPVMNYSNKSMLKPTTFDINKAVMRCLTKNLAMFGLGLYIYAGEDLPEEETPAPEKVELAQTKIKALYTLAGAKGRDSDNVKAIIKKKYNVDSTKELSLEQYNVMIKGFRGMPDKEVTK
jgi:hypothetical protein